MASVSSNLDSAKDSMEKILKHIQGELTKIRAGKANPAVLEGISVNYYGTPTPLSQVAAVNTPDARTIVIKPWEKNMLVEIEKAIKISDLGINPNNDGEVIRLVVPPLTEERRKDLVKQVKNEVEAGRVKVRNVRKDTNESLKKLLKEGVSEDDVKAGETKVQTLTDGYIKKLDEVLAAKEKEIMTV